MFVPEVRDLVVPALTIVRDDLCFPYLVDLVVVTRTGILHKHIDVKDGNGATLLRVRGLTWDFKKKRTMYDPMGVPIITMYREAMSSRQKWKVYRGESLDRSNLLYTVRKSNPIQIKPQLEVFLASNPTGDICDFRVIGRYGSLSFKVHKGDTILAEVNDKFKLGSLNKGESEARIYPGVDYAFIVSLLVMVDELASLC
ncbi:hypothetical protein OROGR_015960 [Orobanche gracilis]